MKSSPTQRRIRVLVVEDSPVVRDLLVHVLESDPNIEVIGVAENGTVALERIPHCQPDVITMDIEMPRMNGVEATRHIMQQWPTPIVVVTGVPVRGAGACDIQALAAGALAIVEKPAYVQDFHQSANAQQLLKTVKLMAEVKVVRRWAPKASPVLPPAPPQSVAGELQVIGLGASTGGPAILQHIFAKLPSTYPYPILVVQHITAGFTTAFIEWLNRTTEFSVVMAHHGQRLNPGTAYIAPDGMHLGVAAGLRANVAESVPVNGHRPSVSFLFRSLLETYEKKAGCVLLSGMGSDGAQELKLLKDAGARTAVQHRDSATVSGMPSAALKLDPTILELDPDTIVSTLIDWAKTSKP